MTKKRVKEQLTKTVKLGSILNKIDYKILLSLPLYNTNKALSEHLNKKPSFISRKLKNLKNEGLISFIPLYNLRQYSLTDKGKELINYFLTGVRNEEHPIRYHNICFVSNIIRTPIKLGERLKENNWVIYIPKNWIGYKKVIENVMVLFTPHTVQFFVEGIYSDKQEEAVHNSIKKVIKIKEYLESEYKGLVLGNVEEVTYINNQHLARMYDELAVEYLKTSLKLGHKVTYRSDRINIDQSEGIPELEAVDKVYAQEDLRNITKWYEWIVRTGILPQNLTENQINLIKEINNMDKNFNAKLQGLLTLNEGMVNQQQLQNKQMETFRVAMEEHLKLISSLTKLTKQLKKSSENTILKRLKRFLTKK